MADLNSLEKQIIDLAQTMTQGFALIKTDLDELTAATARGFSQVEERFGKIDTKFEKVEERFEKVDQTLERVERNQLAQKEEIIGLETRVSSLEHPVAQ